MNSEIIGFVHRSWLRRIELLCLASAMIGWDITCISQKFESQALSCAEGEPVPVRNLQAPHYLVMCMAQSVICCLPLSRAKSLDIVSVAVDYRNVK